MLTLLFFLNLILCPDQALTCLWLYILMDILHVIAINDIKFIMRHPFTPRIIYEHDTT